MSANPHLIAYYETHYWVHGEFPSKKDVKELFNYDEAEFDKEVVLIIEPLKNRGHDTSSLEKLPPVRNLSTVKPKDGLDPEFVLAVSVICDTIDKRPRAAKLKALNFTTMRWNAFMKKKEYRDYFEKRLHESFGDVEHGAKLSLARNVEAGDLQSIKYFMELTGKYRPDSELKINLGIILGRIMEILSAKVEPKILSEIADEMDMILAPRGELSA